MSDHFDRPSHRVQPREIRDIPFDDGIEVSRGDIAVFIVTVVVFVITMAWWYV